MKNYVALDRQFSLFSIREDEVVSNDMFSAWGYSKQKAWDDLDQEFRCVILAEAGAGKTEELRHRASVLACQGKPAFFIRIENIESDFFQAFEIGEESQYQTWLKSTDEAWFFLDSVDEARLESPKCFEKALRLFAKAIKASSHRAHIYLSSRPYAWRPEADRRLLDEILFLPAPQKDEDEPNNKTDPGSALKIYTMLHLDKERIERFCTVREAKNIDQLLHDIERANLWNLAERPFDLEGILAKWEDDKALGGRLELLQHNIDSRLADKHNINRAEVQPLNLAKAREGARRLSAAVVLTGHAGISVPDSDSSKTSIQAEIVLSDWEPADVRALLERGIFNDIIYGAVRFRHRDVRELLAAEWFEGLLKTGNSRYAIGSLFFREQYGEDIVTPRLRPILSWLILFDNEVCRRALEILPEIAIEGGDPSNLPLYERQKMLRDIVQRIALDKDDRSAQDNSSIARISKSDLATDTLQLINEHFDNDEAIFFLGRLVWQGMMESCVGSLIDIATDSQRGIYARIAAVRATMTCGSVDQKNCLWQKLNEDKVEIPRELLAELLEETVAEDVTSITLLINSIGKLQPYDRYKYTGLSRSFHEFVKRLPITGDQQPAVQFVEGVYAFLTIPPYVERRECRVSKEYSWLVGPAIHAIERLVEAKCSVVFRNEFLSTMLMVPALRHWHDHDLDEYKIQLQTLIPSWPELNDELYWASVNQARENKASKSSDPFVDDWSISWLGHFWSFDTSSLPRLINYIRSRPLQDDRLVALSSAFRVYSQADKPAHELAALQNAVSGNRVLQNQLEKYLSPIESDEARKYREEDENHKRERKIREEREKQARDSWIYKLRKNPDRVRNPPNLKPGELSNDQYWLMQELDGSSASTDRYDYKNWQALSKEFGEEVALAYRDAAVKHWRRYLPALRSDGTRKDNSIPWSLIFAMAGLEIEAEEDSFLANLGETEACHALRYITWELNGFPSWFEKIYKYFPDVTVEAVTKELFWELENTEDNAPMHYIISDLVHYSPWIHSAIAPTLLEWGKSNQTKLNINRHYFLQILVNGGTSAEVVEALARQEIAIATNVDVVTWWYALFVDCKPEDGIPAFDQWISSLDKVTATRAAQIFATTLMGERHQRESISNFGCFKTAVHLKSLYILMHKHIRAKEDINRLGGGSYTPELRDDAQDARNRLFNLLSEIPGKASFSAIERLIREHPDPDYRPWMAKQAYKRAEEDGDLEPWTAEQVYSFDKLQKITPATHRQLFELAVQRLGDLKNWLEYGNDSPWKTWQRVESETEMRTLIAGWLGQSCRDQYITAQEPELANSQRMDIWLHNTYVHSPVPIELKILDKDWSGPDLCERLRNQLVGDYLREASAGCGVMLLVWQGKVSEKKWEINGRRTKLDELAAELTKYWQNISDQYPGVEAIDVIVIDSTKRGQVSKT